MPGPFSPIRSERTVKNEIGSENWKIEIRKMRISLGRVRLGVAWRKKSPPVLGEALREIQERGTESA
jgi:hypothetical protein